MKHYHHSPFLSENVDPRIETKQEDWTQGTVVWFNRLSEQILSYYNCDNIRMNQYYALSWELGDIIRDELPKLYWANTVEFTHKQVRKRLMLEGLIRTWVIFEWYNLPPKFMWHTYQQIVDTLLWYAQYSPKEERELIMEFLLTDGRCGWKWGQFNEKNQSVQAILSQVAYSQIVQQFPKE